MRPRSSRSHSTLVPAASMMASRPHVVAPSTRRVTIGNVPDGPRSNGAFGADDDVEHPAGAERDLGVAGPHAALAEQRRLLVAEHAGDRGRAGQGPGLTDDTGRVDDRGQHRRWDPQCRQRGFGPRIVGPVPQPGQRGVRGVGDVQGAAGEGPGDPGVDGPEAQVTSPARVGLVQEPLELRGRLVRRQADAFGPQLQAPPDRSQVLPADPGPDGFARGPVPEHGRAALVRDTDRTDGPEVLERRPGHAGHDVGHDGRVELDKAGGGRRREQRLAVLGDDARRRRRPRRAPRRCRRRRRGPAPMASPALRATEAQGHAGDGPNAEGSPSLPGFRIPRVERRLDGGEHVEAGAEGLGHEASPVQPDPVVVAEAPPCWRTARVPASHAAR